MTTYDKKYHDGQYKTVGQAAVAINKGEHQEVGETIAEMGKSYDNELREALAKNKDIDHYYIVVMRKKEILHPSLPVSNVIRQYFIHPFPFKPSVKTIKEEYVNADFDIWEVKNGDPIHKITLPAPDAWNTILKNPDDHDPDLIKGMRKYDDGTLDRNY